jgi:serine/threonine-protein kinase
MAVPFDLGRRKILSAPVPVLSSIYGRFDFTHPDFAISRNGTLVYVPASSQGRKLAWVDREGREAPISDVDKYYELPRISPDGVHIVVGQGEKLWVVDVERGTSVPLAFQEGESLSTVDVSENCCPVWTPDGLRVTFSSNRSGAWDIYEAPADGSGEVQPLLKDGEHAQFPSSWSPDGKVLAFIQRSASTGNDIWLLPREGEPSPFVTTPSWEQAPGFSPDGRFITYVSNESGRNEVYAQPCSEPGGKKLVSTNGGDEPIWSADGRELFYRQGDRVLTVSVRTEPNLHVGKPRVLFEGLYEPSMLVNYDVTTDGQRFLMVKRNALSVRRRIRVVQNWFEELKRLVPTEN